MKPSCEVLVKKIYKVYTHHKIYINTMILLHITSLCVFECVV